MKLELFRHARGTDRETCSAPVGEVNICAHEQKAHGLQCMWIVLIGMAKNAVFAMLVDLAKGFKV